MNTPFETVTPRRPNPPRQPLPPGACDTHAHVFGPYQRFPLAHPSSYAPPLAPAPLHLAMLDILGAARGVLVQPAPYGDDAAPMLDAIAASNGRVRGIGVAGSGATPEQLQQLHDGGIRGLRFVEVRDPQGQPYVGSVGADQLLAMAPVMKSIGLHAQLWAPLDDYQQLLPPLLATGVPLVLDHMACLKTERGVDDPAFQTVLKALQDGAVWIKLSVCRVSKQAPACLDLKPFHDALVAANPQRLLWGSDWPFVRMGEQSPDAGQLLDLFHDWVPDGATRHTILVDNPAALYGFDSNQGK